VVPQRVRLSVLGDVSCSDKPALGPNHRKLNAKNYGVEDYTFECTWGLLSSGT
jgi:hypothetical protein